MKLEDICSLPVRELADKNCLLFLWTTFPKLEEAFQVIKSWGFIYKTCAFVWAKQNLNKDSFFMGLGYWTRSNVEVCLLATKGSPKRLSRKVRQLIVSHREKHSRKPNEIRDRIIQLVGDLPRIELFAREKYPGWDAWGDEIQPDIVFPLPKW